MNIIEQIRNIMNDNNSVVKLSVWTDEMAVYLWEKEVGISIFPKQNKVIFDVEGYDFKLDCGQMMIMAKVMEVLLNNMDELKRMTAYVE
jgi:hypothetical protein